MAILFQELPNPTSYLGFGIFSVLAFVIVVLIGILFRVFAQQSADKKEQAASQKERDMLLMAFVDRHRGEFTSALERISISFAGSLDNFRAAFDRQERNLDEVLLTTRVIDQLDKLKRGGSPLTEGDIEKVVMSIIRERANQR